MLQGDSTEEAWGKEITIPAAAVVGVGILVGTGISYLNNWATDHFPELEKFEDNVGEAVVDTWNGLTTGIKDIFHGK